MLLALFVLFANLVITINTKNGCTCTGSTCTLGDKSLEPWCFIDKDSCRYESDWDVCVDPCASLQPGDPCTPIYEVTSRPSSSPQCVSVRQGTNLCVHDSKTCQRSDTDTLVDSGSGCNGQHTLGQCDCLLSVDFSSLDLFYCSLPNDSYLLVEKIAECDPCKCKDSCSNGSCQPNKYDECISKSPEVSTGRSGFIYCESVDTSDTSSELSRGPNDHQSTDSPDTQTDESGTDDKWIIVVIVLASLLIIMFAAYWVWKCVVVNRQHQEQLMQMHTQIRTLQLSQERMEDSMNRNNSNGSLNASHTRSYSYNQQPGLPTHIRNGVAHPSYVQTGEASYINPSHQRIPRSQIIPSVVASPGASHQVPVYSAAQPQPQYCKPPQPKWEDEGPENFVDANEDFGPTPQVPSVVSVVSNRDLQPQFRQITAGCEGEYV